MGSGALAQSSATSGLTNFPDLPRAEPFRETVFTISVDDPYRWMEKADRRAELERWVNASSLHTTTELAALPGREGFFKDMEALSRANSRYLSAQEAGGRLFFEMLAPDKQIPVLMVRERSKDRLLLDPMPGSDGKTPRAISSFSVSPDGRMSAKLAAMMRAKWGDRHLVLIRSDGKAGHGLGSTRDQGLEERADIYSFFMNRFGVAAFVR